MLASMKQVVSDLSSTNVVREVYSESGRAVSFIPTMPNLSGVSVLASHCCAFPELSARHPSIVRTANNMTFPIGLFFSGCDRKPSYENSVQITLLSGDGSGLPLRNVRDCTLCRGIA